MNRSSQYHPLQWIVKCRPMGQAFFEPIAAFNSDQVAIDYARRCHVVNQQNVYFVSARKGNRWVSIKQYG